MASVPANKLSNTMTPAEIRTELLAPSFPVEKMTELLDHDNLEMRAEFRKFISEPVMVPRYQRLIGQCSQYGLSLVKTPLNKLISIQ